MSIITSAFRDAYDLSFQVSPIILQGGIASSMPGQMLPIIGLTGQLVGLAQGLLSNGFSMDDFFARYLPIPGGTVISNAIGTYPFANQQVAANAIIKQPLNISLLMIAPVKDTGGYLTKLALFTALVSSLENHNSAGGTYTIATPAFLYTNCVMTGMADVTSGDTKQKQIQWQLDFVKPLITSQDASIAYNGAMAKFAAGTQVTSGAWSGANAAIGAPVQGATGIAQQVSGLAGSVNTFLSAAP